MGRERRRNERERGRYLSVREVSSFQGCTYSEMVPLLTEVT